MSEDEDTRARFPRYGDPECQHPIDSQIRDGMGTVCGECGVVQVFGW